MFYDYEGLRNGGTFLLDTTTATAIASKPKQIVGKVVTLTANNTVGYGSSADIPLGFVESIEYEVSGSDTYCVAVVWGVTHCDVPCVGTETFGNYLYCDGAGGLKASTDATNAKAFSVDSTAKTCTVKID